MLKQLKEQGLCEPRDEGPSMFVGFSARALQVAQVGLTGAHAQTALAEAALEQLRCEVLDRRGKHVIHRYLERLAGFAAIGALIGVLIEALHHFVPAPRHHLRRTAELHGLLA